MPTPSALTTSTVPRPASPPSPAARPPSSPWTLFSDVLARRAPELEVLTPADPDARGSQLSVRHPQAWPLCQALIAEGVVGDFRAPDVLRFGLTPLYTRFEDVWIAADRLGRILSTGNWREPRFQGRLRVT